MFILKSTMLLIGNLLMLQRPLPRILEGQGAGNNQGLPQATLLPRRQYHSPQSGVNWEPGQLPTRFGNSPLLVHGSQLEEQLKTIGD